MGENADQVGPSNQETEETTALLCHTVSMSQECSGRALKGITYILTSPSWGREQEPFQGDSHPHRLGVCVTHQMCRDRGKGTVDTLCPQHSTSCNRDSPPPEDSQIGNTSTVPQHIPLSSFMNLMQLCHGKSQPSLLSECGPQAMCKL